MVNERGSVIISVFSTTAGIGKTVTAINLAAGIAHEGYSVCLVDLLVLRHVAHVGGCGCPLVTALSLTRPYGS